jgi:hypothetical protein
MSDFNKTGGPAFPRAASYNEKLSVDNSFNSRAQDGMTLRDAIAIAAMHALIGRKHSSGDKERISDRAYKFADAMLFERKK